MSPDITMCESKVFCIFTQKANGKENFNIWKYN